MYFFLRYPLLCFIKIFCKTAEEGAQTSLYLALSDDVKDVTGKYFVDCRLDETGANQCLANMELAEKLWPAICGTFAWTTMSSEDKMPSEDTIFWNKKAAELTSPVVNNYKSQIDYVNDYACSKLEDIETKYPCIKQPTSELKDACLDYVQPVVDKG
ncbi:Retinol dehydrogenase 12 [Bulinus truncatus]|nr:Retinol dehydrogenase 12 [Bulinus truncatus]